MQHLSIIAVFMLRLSIVVSFSRLGAKNALSSAGAGVHAAVMQKSGNSVCRVSSMRHLCSTSAPSSDAGKDSPTKKSSVGKKAVAADKIYRPIVADSRPKGQARQNSAGRRAPVVEGAVLREGTRGSPRRTPKNPQEEFAQEFRQVIRTREFLPAMALYAKMKGAKVTPRESIMTGLLSICQRKEHLVSAMEIFEDFLAAGIAPNESAYMSLIRCYADNGQIDEALQCIEQMGSSALEPKLRTYHPVLEAVCMKNDFKGAIQIIKQMQITGVVPKSEQVTLLLEVAASSGSLDTSAGRAEIDMLLQSASIDLLGMETEEMRRVVSAFCRMSPADVIEEGILVETRDDLPGEILEINETRTASIVTAMNTTFANVPTLLSDMVCSPSVIDNTIPLGFDGTSKVAFQPDIYTIASESEAIGGKAAMALRNRRARLVDICQATCLCPNCGGELVPLLLNEEERKRVRLGLMKIASTSSMSQLRNMQAYGEWLKNQTEFTYIIDGANVAYNHQNFDSGKFSYRQIELIVDKMLARGDGKVLVLLPYSYAQKVVPNSSKQRGRRNLTYVSATDLRIIQRFEEEGMLYLVPQGADDDWYWIYATVTEGRSEAAYVVTNDLMRDHRLAFLEPRPFIRWRTTQVMNFCFSKAVKDGDATDPETFIIDPGRYSREIQNNLQVEDGQEVKRWHVPAADRRAWLCLSTEPPSSGLGTDSAVAIKGNSLLDDSGIRKSVDRVSSSSSEPPPGSIASIGGHEVKRSSENASFVPLARRKLF